MSVLYTIIPVEDIFRGVNDAPTPTLWSYRGRLVYVEEDQFGSGRVVRLVSTDPRDFLDPEFAPGTRLWAGITTKRLSGSS